MLKSERLGCAAVAFSKGPKHKQYEDRYALFPKAKKAVSRQDRGELFAVFDGIGSAPMGMRSAQHMSDKIIDFYQHSADHPASCEGISDLLFSGNQEIHDWGFMPGSSNRPLGGCAGSVVWIYGKKMFVFHAGDTVAVMIRDGVPKQLTHLHELNGAIYRYFGLGGHLIIDAAGQELRNYDRILLMSDGVTKVYHPVEAAAVIQEHDDIKLAVEDLVQRSRAKKSSDDITVLLIEYDQYAE